MYTLKSISKCMDNQTTQLNIIDEIVIEIYIVSHNQLRLKIASVDYYVLIGNYVIYITYYLSV